VISTIWCSLIYGDLLGIAPESIPPLVLKAIILDTLLVHRLHRDQAPPQADLVRRSSNTLGWSGKG
jgi:hypothetical protein